MIPPSPVPVPQMVWTVSESLSMMYCGMQRTGLMSRRFVDAAVRASASPPPFSWGFLEEVAVAAGGEGERRSISDRERRERPARPKRVWKGSG